jgi:pimeloyl-ACP methyl ester carboxylesterase
MAVTNVVLVHGAWGDGSHWRNVIPLLAGAGLNVTAVQNPLTSLDDDIHRTNVLLDQQDGPTVLVGHSYGGAVISGAGHHANVAGLVFIAAFAPDEGDTVGGLLSHGGNAIPDGLLAPDGDGFLWLNFDAFGPGFAQDVDPVDVLVMARAQKPISGACFEAPAGPPAWRAKPSWYQLSSQDHMIPPDIQTFMAERINPRGILSLDSSHASLASQPRAVADLIIRAAGEL